MLNNLTGLRFYTALWVFVFHLSTEYIKQFDFLPFNKGYLGVDVFFVLSGFILTFVYYKSFFAEKVTVAKYHDFIVKRFAKIYPMHLLTFFAIAVMLVVGKYIFHQNTLRLQYDTIAQNLLLVHAWNTTKEISWNFPSWSISAEWFAYLFLFALAAIIYKFNKILWILVGIFVVAFFIYFWLAIPNFSMNNYTFNALARIIPEFVLGILIGLIKMRFHINKFFASVIFVLGLILFWFLCHNQNVIDQLAILCFAVVILSLSYNTIFDFLFNSKAMVFLGNISYAFYLTQFISFIIFEQVFKWVHVQGNAEIIAKFVFVLSLNLFFAAMCYKYYEEPIRQYMVRKFTKPKN